MNRPYTYIAVSALLLGLLAMVVRDPRDRHRVTLDVKELAEIIEQERDHVTADELAEMVMRGSQSLRVIDVRDSAAFASYHIPTAVRHDISDLVETAFAETETVIVYSEGGIHAAQAWMLLAAQGRKNVFALRGGLSEWDDKILFPAVSSELSPKERERIRKRSVFFGGDPRTSSSKTSPTRKPSVTPDTKILKEQEKQREIC